MFTFSDSDLQELGHGRAGKIKAAETAALGSQSADYREADHRCTEDHQADDHSTDSSPDDGSTDTDSVDTDTDGYVSTDDDNDDDHEAPKKAPEVPQAHDAPEPPPEPHEPHEPHEPPEPPEAPEAHAPPEPHAPRDDGAIQINNNIQNYPAESFVIIQQLDNAIFNKYRDKLPKHAEKEDLIEQLREIIRSTQNINIQILSDIYHYINLDMNKRILNVHEHTKFDTVFFKTNTNSWQELMENIRSLAGKLLLESVRIWDLFEEIYKGAAPYIANAQYVIDTLTPYLENKLFCEHRSNNHFRNLFHTTRAVKSLHKVIDACEEQIRKENAPRSTRSLLSYPSGSDNE